MSDNPIEQEEILLGFYVAAVVITLAWVLDWRHYVRFFEPFLSKFKNKIAIIRVLFIIFFLASVYQLIDGVSNIKLSRSVVKGALLDALFIIIVFVAFDGIFRWRLGAPKR